MVKLASAREIRTYGPRLARARLEYINAGLYAFATILLLCGFTALLSTEPKSGLCLILFALILIFVVNLHDLFAHLAGIDYQLPLMEFDMQFVVVEFTVPMLQAIGSLLSFFGVLFLLIEAEKGYVNYKLENHALNMLIAGPSLWLLGSILNSCQIYERADGHIQILQECVCLPFLMGSLLFLVGAILNRHEQTRLVHHGLALLALSWIWLGIFGSLLFFIGGLANVIKVFNMLQIEGIRLEKLRGGAQERLIHMREGGAPFILEEDRRIAWQAKEGSSTTAVPTPYKDALIGQT